MFFRPGDIAVEGPKVRFQPVNPMLGFSLDKAAQRDFQVFGDRLGLLQHYGDESFDVSRVAAMDLDKNYLVAIHQGLCPTGGYSVSVESVRVAAGSVTITVDFQEPGPDDIVTMAMTTPSLFLLVPRRRGTRSSAFIFRDKEGALLAERMPVYGKAAPNAQI